MSLFDGWLLATDLDGTLLHTDKQIGDENLAALRDFCENGGKFVVATGRAVYTSERFLKVLPQTLPAILYNGSVLYDYSKKEIVWEHTHTEYMREYLAAVMKKFPQIGVEILIGEEFFVPQDNIILEQQRQAEKISMKFCSLDEVPQGWYKVLFGVLPEEMEDFRATLPRTDEAYYIQSSDFYYEMLPAGCSKGSALAELTRRYNIPREKIIAIGDCENDIEMLEFAAYGVAVANAMPMVKEKADFVTVSNDQNAAAAVIEKLQTHLMRKG